MLNIFHFFTSCLFYEAGKVYTSSNPLQREVFLIFASNIHFLAKRNKVLVNI